MLKRVQLGSLIRVAVMVALLAVIGLQYLPLPVRGQVGPANHLDGPQVSYLFGSGSQTGGKPITLRVKLNGPAPTGGAAVVLTSDEPDVIPLPATATVPAGADEFTFTANTNPVSADIYVRVSAGYGGVTKGREVLIRDPELRSLSVQSVIRGGGQGKITVCLTGAAPVGGTTVNLGNGIQPAGIIASPLQVPATITIPAGKGCVSIAVDAEEVLEDVPVTVTASYRGVNLSANTIVRNFAPASPSIAVSFTPTGDPLFCNVFVHVTGFAPSTTYAVEHRIYEGGSYIWSPGATSFTTDGSGNVMYNVFSYYNVASEIDVLSDGKSTGRVAITCPAPTATATATATETEVPTATATNTPEPTATNTAVPTATATNTAVPMLSLGCQTLNLASFDGTYTGAGINSFAFLTGEVITASSSTATGSAAVTIELNFTPDGGTVETSSTTIPGTLTYSVSTAVDADVGWATNTGGTTWAISCAAGSPV